MNTFLTSLLSASVAGSPAPAIEPSDLDPAPLFAASETAAAPFATGPLTAIMNYRRTTPRLATGGRPTVAGYEAAKKAGFGLVIDMRGRDEAGVAEEAAAAERLGLKRVERPLPASTGELAAYIDDLAALMEDEANHPVLLHCGTGNRVGIVWALYRARQGVPAGIALDEARSIGLTSGEARVRELLTGGGLEAAGE